MDGVGWVVRREETLVHFLEVCEGLGEVRRIYGFLRAEDVLSFGAADWGDVKG